MGSDENWSVVGLAVRWSFVTVGEAYQWIANGLSMYTLGQHQIGAEEVDVVSLDHLHCEHSRLEKDTGWRKEPSKLRRALCAIGPTVLFFSVL